MLRHPRRLFGTSLRWGARLTWAAALAWVTACSLVPTKLERPTLSVVGVELTGGNLLQQNMLVTFDIQNPNDRVLPVTSLHAELNIGGNRVASGTLSRAFIVPAQGSNRFDMNITANLALALLSMGEMSAQRSDAIVYDLSGAADIDLPLLKNLPFHQSGTFPLRLPQ